VPRVVIAIPTIFLAGTFPVKFFRSEVLWIFPETVGRKFPNLARCRMSDERPRYKVIERCFLQPVGYASPRLCEAGETVEFAGVPGAALKPLNASACAAKAASINLCVIDVGAELMSQRRRMARSLGFTGSNSLAAREHVERFVNTHSAERTKP
jgi:hypothetical protein